MSEHGQSFVQPVGEWNPAVIDGDPDAQCPAENGCRCLLGKGHRLSHRCAHGYWLNLDG